MTRPSNSLCIFAATLAVAGLIGLRAAHAAEPRDPIQREDIALIRTQLGRIEQVIDRLEKRQRAQPGRRVILDIDRLRADIDAIRDGLSTYLSPPRMQPREPSPLSGQYRARQAGARHAADQP